MLTLTFLKLIKILESRYVAWNKHEPQEGVFDFEGQNDLIKFIQLAQKYNLYVILRPGPYICAEWEYVSIIMMTMLIMM